MENTPSSFFLAFTVNSGWELALKKANPHLVAHFLNKKEYLQEISHNEKKYLGKALKDICSLQELENLQEHIFSLLKRINPHYTFENETLVVLKSN